MISLSDQMNRPLNLSHYPKRIVSIVPSQTELLYDLGLEKEIVGITKFCIHPTKAKFEKTIIGGTKNVNFEKIKNLQPELIIANKEENTQEIIFECEKICPVYVSDINTFDKSLEMILDIGMLTNTWSKAQDLENKLAEKYKSIKKNTSSRNNVLYLIWNEPPMSIGRDTFIHSMLSMSGFRNVFKSKKRYPILDSQNININPDFIFLSSEPFPFKEKHKDQWQKVFPNSTIIFVDGEAFSWYGSRLTKTFDYLQHLISTLDETNIV